MIPGVLIFLISQQLLGLLGTLVTQTPQQLMESLDESAEMFCTHNDNNLQSMNWYRQLSGRGIELIANIVTNGEPTFETGFDKGRYNIAYTKSEVLKGSFKISPLMSVDSGTYFCAASHYPAYFGGGTKITVLENDIIEPTTVKILEPSKRETTRKKLVTLVCVATGFYPDHVSITWKINERNETDRCKMDDSAAWSEKSSTFSITSRLRVHWKEWSNTKNLFSCSVCFFNGNATKCFPATIRGIQHCGTTAEENKWSGNAAELSYTLILVKSALFALFLTIFVWKFKGSKV